MQTYLKSRPAWIQLLIFLGIAFALFIILSLVGALLLSTMTGISLLDVGKLDRMQTNPKMIYFIRGLILVQFLSLFLIPSLLFAKLSDPRPGQYLGMRAPSKAAFWILALAAMLVAFPLTEWLGYLNQQMSLSHTLQNWMKTKEEEANRQIQFMLSRHTPEQLILNIAFIALTAGIGEELFFRGVLQRIFIRWTRNPWAGILITATLFSAFHFQFFGFLPRLLLGVILGAIYWYSGSLLTAMLAHFLYDAAIIVIVYFQPHMIEQADKTLIDPSRLAIMGGISTVFLILVIRLMKRISTRRYEDVYKEDLPATDNFSF